MQGLPSRRRRGARHERRTHPLDRLPRRRRRAAGHRPRRPRPARGNVDEDGPPVERRVDRPRPIVLARRVGLARPVAAQEYLAGYLIEESLSIDNLFVFLLVFGSLGIALRYQRKVLFWGILGAILHARRVHLRGVAVLERFSWVMYLFGALLVVTAIRLLRSHGVRPTRSATRWCVSRGASSRSRPSTPAAPSPCAARAAGCSTPLAIALGRGRVGRRRVRRGLRAGRPRRVRRRVRRVHLERGGHPRPALAVLRARRGACSVSSTSAGAWPWCSASSARRCCSPTSSTSPSACR